VAVPTIPDIPQRYDMVDVAGPQEAAEKYQSSKDVSPQTVHAPLWRKSGAFHGQGGLNLNHFPMLRN
jgi:hypothetical protein